MTFKYRYRKQIIIGSIFLLFLLMTGGVVLTKSLTKEKPKKKTTIMALKKTESNNITTITDEEEIYVDIKGEVNLPGTYLIKSNSRVKDVIDMAGGLTDKADTSVVNLSKKVEDEMVIIIYSKWEVSNFIKTKEQETAAIEACKYSENYQLQNDACIDGNKSQNNESDTSTTISLNKATKEELMTLSGIGEAKALDIIDYRTSNGGFKNIEEIKNIKGIGDSIFDKIKNRLTL